ncbi:MAG TPA: DUF1592 domain-containing protein [Bryobacteraceae bacterium]
MRFRLSPTLFFLAWTSLHAQTPDEVKTVVGHYCSACHQGKSPAGGLNLATLVATKAPAEDPSSWGHVLARVRNSEMPPKGLPAPAPDEREKLVSWIESALKTAACADGPTPGPYPLRRLNRDEYAATVRDLLNVHVNAAHGLPSDGAGGEGFDNAAETLFISPIHAEKYLSAAKEALEYAAKDPKSRAVFLPGQPDSTDSSEEAATRALTAFLPRAFRRPARPGEVEHYLTFFRNAHKRGESFDHSILLSLEAVLISPSFLFRIEDPNPGPESRLVDNYAMASRLSYFLWGSMPDAALFDLASKGKLQEPETLKAQVIRMLSDLKSRDFAERFVEQWLGTRELGRDIKPDQKLFPEYYDAEIQSAIRYEPVLFFQEILSKNLSLLNLIDSKFTVVPGKLAKFYGISAKGMSQQPKHADLPEDSHRGGILTMAAVLAVSSYPQRTSPVLRGKWVLENILGTPPPPPPPNVPALKENEAGAAPQTLRERLEQHRANAVCATCHDRIDPLGFALENYDVLGRWRTSDAGKPIDSAGQLPDGTKIAGPEDLKRVLLERKDGFIRFFTTKMLGYALGRGLTPADACTVDQIVAKVAEGNYNSQTLIREIVLSVPFRYVERSATNARSTTSPAGTSQKK